MLDQNVPIYISTNNVLLSSGIDGIIPPSFFTRVLNKAGKIIYPIH
jgi:2'-phosphotransferase